MQPKEIGYLKLSLVVFQLLLILLGAPLTHDFLFDLLNGAVINTVTLSVLFSLNAYAYYKSAQNKFPKCGHMVCFVAIAIQSSLALFVISTGILAAESYLLITDQIPFNIKNWLYPNRKEKK